MSWLSLASLRWPWCYSRARHERILDLSMRIGRAALEQERIHYRALLDRRVKEMVVIVREHTNLSTLLDETEARCARAEGLLLQAAFGSPSPKKPLRKAAKATKRKPV